MTRGCDCFGQQKGAQNALGSLLRSRYLDGIFRIEHQTEEDQEWSGRKEEFVKTPRHCQLWKTFSHAVKLQLRIPYIFTKLGEVRLWLVWTCFCLQQEDFQSLTWVQMDPDTLLLVYLNECIVDLILFSSDILKLGLTYIEMIELMCVEFVLEKAFATTIQSKPIESTFYLRTQKYQNQISSIKLTMHFTFQNVFIL